MFLYPWVQREDGVVRNLNPFPTTTVEQFQKLDFAKQALIENQVSLTDDQVQALVFSIGPHPRDLSGLLNQLRTLKQHIFSKDVNIS
jgi:hypothetical protein